MVGLLHAGMVDAITDFILDASTSPWMYLLVLVSCIIDGFFPPMPSETVVVALAAVAIGTGEPNLWMLAATAAVGATAGDNIAYLIGRSIGIDRYRWMRMPTVARTIAWAERNLTRRGPYVILTARYIPVGRVAVNMSAGAIGFGGAKFVILSVIAGMSWSAYSVIIGALAGSWVHERPLLAAAAAVVITLLVGLGVDLVGKWRRRRAGYSPSGSRHAVGVQTATEPEPVYSAHPNQLT